MEQGVHEDTEGELRLRAHRVEVTAGGLKGGHPRAGGWLREYSSACEGDHRDEHKACGNRVCC